MRQTTRTRKSPGEKIVKDIKRAHHCTAVDTQYRWEGRKQYSSEEKIRIVLDGLRGEDSIAELCRREGISQGVYYKWSKDFMQAGKRRLAGDGGKNRYAPNNDHMNARDAGILRNRPIITKGQISNIKYARVLGIVLAFTRYFIGPIHVTQYFHPHRLNLYPDKIRQAGCFLIYVLRISHFNGNSLYLITNIGNHRRVRFSSSAAHWCNLCYQPGTPGWSTHWNDTAIGPYRAWL